MGRATKSKQSEHAYATLEPRIHHVSEKTIKKKWKKLNNSTQDKLRQLFLSLRVQAAASHSKRKNASGIEEATDNIAERYLVMHMVLHETFLTMMQNYAEDASHAVSPKYSRFALRF